MFAEQGKTVVTYQGTKTGTEARKTSTDGPYVTATYVEEYTTTKKSANIHVNIVT